MGRSQPEDQSVNRLTTPDPFQLAVQMPIGIFRISLIVSVAILVLFGFQQIRGARTVKLAHEVEKGEPGGQQAGIKLRPFSAGSPFSAPGIQKIVDDADENGD